MIENIPVKGEFIDLVDISTISTSIHKDLSPKMYTFTYLLAQFYQCLDKLDSPELQSQCANQTTSP